MTVPIASGLGLSLKESASVAMVGGADGPMVLFTSLALAKHLFVPITVVAYLYLGLTYGGYPYLVKLLIPKRLRAIKMVEKKAPKNYDAKRTMVKQPETRNTILHTGLQKKPASLSHHNF